MLNLYLSWQWAVWGTLLLNLPPERCLTKNKPTNNKQFKIENAVNMRTSLRLPMMIAALGALFSLVACGPLIYDKDDRNMVDATSYTAWTYINLATGQASVVQEYGDEPHGTPPEKWHFALHRHNCKTNGATVLETAFTNINDIIARGAVPDGEYVGDVWTDDTVIYIRYVGDGRWRRQICRILL